MAKPEPNDVLDLGEHCAECGQLDFLPFKCPDCRRVFCGLHRLAHRSCSGAGATSRAAGAAAAAASPPPPAPSSLIVCPLCAKGVNVAASETPDEAHARHSRARDPTTGRPECDPDNWRRVHDRPQCQAPSGCRARPVASERVSCGRCGALLCLKHRLPEDHACIGLQREQQQLERQRQQQQQQQGRQGQSAGARLLAEARKAVAAARPPPPPQPAAAAPAAAATNRSNTVAGTAALRARALALPELCPLCPRAADARFATVAELIDHCEQRHGANAGRDLLMARAARRGGGGGGQRDGSSSSKCVVS